MSTCTKTTDSLTHKGTAIQQTRRAPDPEDKEQVILWTDSKKAKCTFFFFNSAAHHTGVVLFLTGYQVLLN